MPAYARRYATLEGDVEDLTIEHFAATILWQIQNPHEMPVRWLCASEEQKQERIQRLQNTFKSWRNEELQMKQERESRVNTILA